MVAAIANALRMFIFSNMNMDKAHNVMRTDRAERGVVSILQFKNSANEILGMAKGRTGSVANGLNSVSNSIEAARTTSKAFNCACKAVNVVSEMVNPILVVASAARVAKSDDKKSAAIMETGAMTAMFTAENAYKNLFGLKKGAEATYKNYKLLNRVAEGLKTFAKSSKILSRVPMGALGGILTGLGFIAVSCAAFAIGHKLGEVIADKTTAKDYAEKHALASEVLSEFATQEYVS